MTLAQDDAKSLIPHIAWFETWGGGSDMCGVIGIIGTEKSQYKRVKRVFTTTVGLQHRGQDAAGLLFIDEWDGFVYTNRWGFISEVLSSAEFKKLKAPCVLGTLGMLQRDPMMRVIFSQMVLRQPGHRWNGTMVISLTTMSWARDWLKDHGSLSSTNDVELFFKKLWCKAYGTEALDESFF